MARVPGHRNHSFAQNAMSSHQCHAWQCVCCCLQPRTHAHSAPTRRLLHSPSTPPSQLARGPRRVHLPDTYTDSTCTPSFPPNTARGLGGDIGSPGRQRPTAMAVAHSGAALALAVLYGLVLMTGASYRMCSTCMGVARPSTIPCRCPVLPCAVFCGVVGAGRHDAAPCLPTMGAQRCCSGCQEATPCRPCLNA